MRWGGREGESNLKVNNVGWLREHFPLISNSIVLELESKNRTIKEFKTVWLRKCVLIYE